MRELHCHENTCSVISINVIFNMMGINGLLNMCTKLQNLKIIIADFTIIKIVRYATFACHDVKGEILSDNEIFF